MDLQFVLSFMSLAVEALTRHFVPLFVEEPESFVSRAIAGVRCGLHLHMLFLRRWWSLAVTLPSPLVTVRVSGRRHRQL